MIAVVDDMGPESELRYVEDVEHFGCNTQALPLLLSDWFGGDGKTL